MRVKLFYFAKVRETLGVDQEEIDLAGSIQTVADLVGFLKVGAAPGILPLMSFHQSEWRLIRK